jgi:predicted TIM-barrel enzyme
MPSFSQLFCQAPVVLPVVHVSSLEQARRNTAVAVRAGADGVFLINHSIPWQELLAIHDRVLDEFSGLWIGVNCLDLAAQEVFDRISDRVAGIWVDNAGIDERNVTQPRAEEIRVRQREHRWNGLYFGGVAFKYQRHVEDLAAACRIAAEYMDVVTTSGTGTGHAAAVEKIAAMKHVLGDHPLAIASGITPDNVDDYLPIADCFLVATGISEAFDELDPKLVRALVEKVRAFRC